MKFAHLLADKLMPINESEPEPENFKEDKLPIKHKEEPQKPKIEYKCSFCGKSNRQVNRLIAGQNAAICDACVEKCLEASTNDKENNLDKKCSFCGRYANESNKVIAGKDGYICEYCIKICDEMIKTENSNSIN